MDELNLNPSEGAVEVVTPQETEQVEQTNEPVKTDNVEVVEPQQETVKPVQSAEDNAKYAEIRRKAEADAESRTRDKMISEMYGESHGIHTYSDYQNAVSQAEQEAKEQQIRQEYESKGVPEELLEELVESRKDREERNREKAERAKVEETNNNYRTFLDYFEKENSRQFDNAKDVISAEVWQEVSNGKSLVDAYTRQEVKSLKAKIAEYEKGAKTQEINNKNALTSTGSTVGNGNSPSDFIAKEVFEANKGNSTWLNQNYDLLKNSMNKWK